MPTLSWEDRDEFLEKEADGGFAITVTIQGVAGTVDGIFFEDYENIITGETGVSSSGPAFLMKDGVLTLPFSKQNVFIASFGNYFIKRIEPDGTGFVLLRLTTV